jgi:hypothetical protein
MKKIGKFKRYRNPQDDEPEYIIVNTKDQVFIGLDGGYPVFSDNIDQAKPFRGQAKFDTLRRFSHVKIEQMFL